MSWKDRKIVKIIMETFTEFGKDDCMAQSAAIAYYTVFALAPLLVIAISVAAFSVQSTGLDEVTGDVQSQVVDQISSVIGEEPANQVAQMIEEARTPNKSMFFNIMSGFVLAFGATAIFAQIQLAMNKIWGVEPDPNQGGIKLFIKKRLLSFGLVLSVAFLLLVSLVISVILQALGDAINSRLNLQLDSYMPAFIQFSLNFLVIACVFAILLRFLPDAKVQWRDVWVGALITSGLFGIGRFGISIYLSQSSVASGFGAAGSLVLLLIWIYYSTIIFLLGAEFTQVWSRYHGHAILPEEGAVAVVNEVHEVNYHAAVE